MGTGFLADLLHSALGPASCLSAINQLQTTCPRFNYYIINIIIMIVCIMQRLRSDAVGGSEGEKKQKTLNSFFKRGNATK